MTRVEIFAAAQRQIEQNRAAGYKTPGALKWAEGDPCPVCRERVTEDVYGGPCDRCWGLVEDK